MLSRTEWLSVYGGACMLSRAVVSDFGTPWTVAHQAPLSMGFPRQETGVGCCFLFHGIWGCVKAKSQGWSWHIWVGQMERQLSRLLILRALAGEQIREKRFGANNSGHVKLKVPSVEMSGRQFSNWVWDLTFMTVAPCKHLAAMPAHSSPPGLAGGSRTRFQSLEKQSPRLINQASSQNYNWNIRPRPRQELNGDCGDPGHRNAGGFKY